MEIIPSCFSNVLKIYIKYFEYIYKEFANYLSGLTKFVNYRLLNIMLDC